MFLFCFLVLGLVKVQLKFTGRRPSHGEAFCYAATYFHSFRVCFVNIEFDWWSTRPDVGLPKRGTECLIFFGWSHFFNSPGWNFFGFPWKFFFFGWSSFFCGSFFWLVPMVGEKNPGHFTPSEIFFYKNVPLGLFFSTFLVRFVLKQHFHIFRLKNSQIWELFRLNIEIFGLKFNLEKSLNHRTF